MPHFEIISSSVRNGRRTHRVALFFKRYILESNLGTASIIDLKAYNFPVFEERLKYLKNPSEEVLEIAEKIKKADGIIIATPEYNGGYPASLKNVIDLLFEEWHRKPIGLATVSAGAFGGMQVLRGLQFTFWKMRAWVMPVSFPVPKVADHYTEDGTPMDKEITEKRAKIFMDEILWSITAVKKMKE
jgi:NAD(P)H-dependent FMN reductase